MKKQFWIIDTDGFGMTEGTHEARGPFATRLAAEKWILSDTKDLWEDSGTSVQTETSRPWCKPLHIVQVVRTIVPEIKVLVKLTDITA